jgi:hypothetical protein
MLQTLLKGTSPITLAQHDDAWILEQTTLPPDDPLDVIAAPPGTPWHADLPAGSMIWRVWIDQATSLPRRVDLVHLGQAWHETLLKSRHMTVWQHSAAPPAQDFFTLPPLPNDVVRFETNPDGTTRLVSETFKVPRPVRGLIWPSATGITTEQNHDPLPWLYTQPQHDDVIRQAFSQSWSDLVHIGLLKTTTYRLPKTGDTVIIRQAARDLMRHLIHYQPAYGREPGNIWTTSRALPVRIEGQQRTAWLLEGEALPVLVVEVDETLLYISGMVDRAERDEVIAALSQLRWANIPP